MPTQELVQPHNHLGAAPWLWTAASRHGHGCLPLTPAPQLLHTLQLSPCSPVPWLPHINLHLEWMQALLCGLICNLVSGPQGMGPLD